MSQQNFLEFDGIQHLGVELSCVHLQRKREDMLVILLTDLIVPIRKVTDEDDDNYDSTGYVLKFF